MKQALQEADHAAKDGEVPIGACILDPSGKIIASAGNKKEGPNNPIGHAEIRAIEKACAEIGDWRLNGHTLVVTLEPCVMCMGAIWQSRVSHVVFGAYDAKGGALSLGYDIYKDKRLNHQFSIMGGIEHYNCSQVLSRFFREKRSSYKFKHPQ
tara:strand:+ start:155 stop:613 length:459 start_codon:yes stop_codon:yes gene_type:complete